MTETIKKRNLVLPIGIIVAVLAIVSVLGIYFMSASNYIALDVNPSIEIQTNRLNQVVSSNTVNADAAQVMAGYQLTDKNLEVVIKDIVDRMILNGYLASNKDNQILVTTDNKNAVEGLTAKVSSIVSTYMTEKQLDANLIQQNITVSDEDIAAAHENNVSAGKMALIEALMKSDSSLTVEKLSTERVSDLIALAKENNIDLKDVIDNNTDANDEQGNTDDANAQNASDEQGNTDDKNAQDANDEQGNIDDANVQDANDEQGNIDDANVQDANDERNNTDDKNAQDANDEQDNTDNVKEQGVNDIQSNANNAD